MRYVIMQLPTSHEAKSNFYDVAKRNGCLPELDEYVLVYQGQLWGDGSNVDKELEHIYSRLNSDDRPYDYRVFSPSVSDVIGVEVSDGEWSEWVFYYVDVVGFKKIWANK